MGPVGILSCCPTTLAHFWVFRCTRYAQLIFLLPCSAEKMPRASVTVRVVGFSGLRIGTTYWSSRCSRGILQSDTLNPSWSERKVKRAFTQSVSPGSPVPGPPWYPGSRTRTSTAPESNCRTSPGWLPGRQEP